jgi:hypothetical protein
VNVNASPDVAALVGQRGGRLFVWADRMACCGGDVRVLSTAADPPRGPHHFRLFDADGFHLFFDPGRLAEPDELQLAVRGRRRPRIEAFWDGCAFPS